jgi:hypothetical protein
MESMSTNPNRVQPLGEALDIRGVAQLIGCSVWAVRQHCIPKGLPCLRLSGTGKLIFYREQVIRWLVAHQQKGGSSL